MGLRQKLDFDDWSMLAQRDRNAFEHFRQVAIEQLINEAPKARRERLRRLQWRIDQERDLSGSPMGACIRLSQMMWDQVVGDGGLVDHLKYLRGSGPAISGRCAEVIPLSPKD